MLGFLQLFFTSLAKKLTEMQYYLLFESLEATLAHITFTNNTVRPDLTWVTTIRAKFTIVSVSQHYFPLSYSHAWLLI